MNGSYSEEVTMVPFQRSEQLQEVTAVEVGFGCNEVSLASGEILHVNGGINMT
jgi:hypothetical protein